MAVTFGTPTIQSATITTSSPVSISHTAGGDLLLLVAGFKANEGISSASWSLGGGQALTEMAQVDGGSVSTSDGELAVWARLNPTAGAGNVSMTGESDFNDFYWAIVLNVSGVDTSDINSAMVVRSTVFNPNTAETSTAAHSSSGSTGNKLLVSGIAMGDNTLGSGISNNASFTEIAEGNTGGGNNGAADASYYMAHGNAPSAVTITWATTAANASVLIEFLVPSARGWGGISQGNFFPSIR